jgi:hypothetical protein
VVVKAATEVKVVDQPGKSHLVQKLQPIRKSVPQIAVVAVDDAAKKVFRN